MGGRNLPSPFFSFWNSVRVHKVLALVNITVRCSVNTNGAVLAADVRSYLEVNLLNLLFKKNESFILIVLLF